VSCAKPSNRVGAVQLDALALALSERDWQVLSALAIFRLMRTDQLRRLVFARHGSKESAERTARSSLRRLCVQIGAICHLERRIGGVRAGSAGFVWHLTSVGRRLLASSFASTTIMDKSGASGSREPPRVATTEPSLRLVDHTLAVTEVAVRLREAERVRQLEILALLPEPECWREYLGQGGQRLALKPDLWAVTVPLDQAGSCTIEDHWFIEVDRGTESLATIRRKGAAYVAYWRAGTEQAKHGVFPRVLWLTPDVARANAITSALADRQPTRRSGSPTVPAGLHWAAAMSDAVKVVLGPVEESCACSLPPNQVKNHVIGGDRRNRHEQAR